MNPLTQFKRILILPDLIAVDARRARVARVGYVAAREHRRQWNKIAEDTAVGSGAFQGEGFIYTAYASTAVYNAVVAIEGGTSPMDSTITAPAGASVGCAVVEAAYRTLRYYFSSFPGLVGEPRRRLRRSALAREPERVHRRRRCGHRCRPGGCQRGDLQPHHRSQSRRADDADRCEHAVRDAAARTGRVAADAAVRCAADAVGRQRAPIHPGESRPVPARPAPVAPEPRVGRRLQRDQGIRRSDQQRAHRGADQHREVRVGERRPPVQRRRARDCRRAQSRPARDSTAVRDGEPRRRRRAGVRPVRQVPLLFWRPVTAINDR